MGECMPFGKYRGLPLQDLPRGYCRWLQDAGILADRPALAATLRRIGKFEAHPDDVVEARAAEAECQATQRERRRAVRSRRAAIRKMNKPALVDALKARGESAEGLKPALLDRLLRLEGVHPDQEDGAAERVASGVEASDGAQIGFAAAH
jgi:hypothetical protein